MKRRTLLAGTAAFAAVPALGRAAEKTKIVWWHAMTAALGDEVNRITAGGNYGWPEVEGVGDRPGFTDPLVTWSTDEASPSGLAYAGGALYAAGLRGERLWKVPVTAPDALGTPEALLTGEFGRLRAVTPTPDGTALWVTTSNRDGRGDPVRDDDRIVVVPLS